MTQWFIYSKNIICFAEKGADNVNLPLQTEDSVLFPELEKYLDSYLWPNLIYVHILTQIGYLLRVVISQDMQVV